MDNGLVLNSSSSEHEISLSLNPCCDGRWSSTARKALGAPELSSLNPCCDGRWSSTEKDVAKKTKCWS